jgi:hypothetical protein
MRFKSTRVGNLQFGLSDPKRLVEIIPKLIFSRLAMYVGNFIKYSLLIIEILTYHLRIYHKKAPSDKKTLICRYEYLSLDLKSEEIITLDHTLLGGYDTFCWDLEWSLFSSSARKFENFVLESGFDLIVLSSWRASMKTFIPPRVLEKIRANGVKVVTINWDTVSKDFWLDYERWYDIFDLNVFTDNPLKLFYRDSSMRDLASHKSFFMYTPWPINASESHSKKDIDVLLTCRVGSYRSQRVDTIKQLLTANLSGTVYAFESTPLFSWAEYLALVKRAKMVINFSGSVDGDQLKGRVWSAISERCLLLESDNEQIKCYFEPNVDYVPFFNADDLISKVRYFIDNEVARKEIAASGYQKMLKNYTAQIFWEKIKHQLNKND